MDTRLKRAAEHWSAQRSSDGTRWWMHAVIIRHINQLVCGEAIDGPFFGFNRLIRAKAPPGGFDRAVSVGCGSGGKEIRLLREGIVKTFDLFEISEAKLAQAKAKAIEHGVAERVNLHGGNAFDLRFNEEFDLVYWNNALHHMFDVKEALGWSHAALKPNGYFAMDDFVGPTRFQWTELELDLAYRVRALLPSRLLAHPRDPAAELDRRVGRPDLEKMIKDDPTEAADSGNILKELAAIFPAADVIFTGGIIYHLALNDVLANFRDEQDYVLLDSLLLLDEMLARNGHTQYAVALARKN